MILKAIYCFIAAALAATISLTSVAQEKTRSPDRAVTSSDTLTGKERLGKKWTDEQRVDNCKVPTDKKGPKKRLNDCQHKPPG